MSRWEGTLEGLVWIDSKRLTEVLEFLLGRVKAQDEVMEEGRNRIVEAERDMANLKTRVNALEESKASLDRSLEDVNKMQDRVHAWSERFKSLEEQHFLLKQSLHKHSEDLSSRIKTTDSALREKVNSVCSALQHTQESLEMRILDQITHLQSRLEELRKEEKEKILNAEEAVANRIGEMMGELEETGQGAEGQKEGKRQRGSLLAPLVVRLKILESKVGELIQPKAITPESVPEPEVTLIHTEITKHPLILELQAQLAQILSQASTFSQQLSFFGTGDEDPVLASMGPESALAKAAKFLSLHQRLEIVEREVGTGMQAWEGIRAKVEQLNTAMETGQLLGEREEGGKAALMRMERRVIEGREKAENRGTHKEEMIESEDGRMEGDMRNTSQSAIEDDLDKLKKLLKDRTTHSEAEDIAITVVKRYFKSLSSKSGNSLLPDSDSKASELEIRLNNYWKSMQEIQGQMRLLREAIGESEVKGRGMLQEMVGEVKEKMKEKSEELTNQIDAIRSAVDRLSSDPAYSDLQEREQYLRSLVFKLKSDLQKLQSDLETKQQPLSPGLLPDLGMEDMSEEQQARKVKIVLQQHDQAIRYLSNKLSGGFEDTTQRLMQSESSPAALGHVEQLRAELKDIIAKFEANKALSQRDMDRINEMYTVLDTKTSKEDLNSKVDRSELVRIYRLLKRKTDDLAHALKRAETCTGSGREDVLISRKKLELECASCGQGLVEGMDPQNQSFQPWGRFPTRGNLVGPGFSHILASLVSSPEGSISIGRRPDEDDRSVLLSPAHSLPNTRARRRNASKLPVVK